MIVRILLLSVLLAAQGVALAHDVGHLGTSGDGLCAVCSASHIHGAATVHSGTVEIAAPARQAAAAFIPVTRHVTNTRPALPRGPPLSLRIVR